MALMKCPDCGKEFSDTAIACPNCGWRMGGRRNTIFKEKSDEDGNDTGLNILAFLFPLVGFILFLVFYEKKPIKSENIAKWAGISFGIHVVIAILIAGWHG